MTAPKHLSYQLVTASLRLIAEVLGLGLMGVTGQAPAAVTGRFMFELKAKGTEKGEDTLDKGLRVAKQLKVGGFILKLNGDGVVFTSRFG